jgi:hypothetical protein
MTAMPQGPWAAPPSSRWSAGRIVALVCGVLLLIPALGLLAGGGVLLWADSSGRNDDGYLISAEDSFSSPGYALATDGIDLSTGADWMPVSAALGDARVRVTAADPDTEIFVGVAAVGDASSYLDGVGRTVVRDFGTGSADEVVIPGSEPSGAPGSQDVWAAQASGPGTQTLTWTPSDGNWTLVVMNADGSANVAVTASIGAQVPALTGLAWGVLITGLVLGVIGLLLIVLAARRRPVAPSGPGYGYPATPAYGYPTASSSGGPVPPGAPPPWIPPSPTDRTSAADAAPDTARTAPPRDPQP